jgi:hypothetical protein
MFGTLVTVKDDGATNEQNAHTWENLNCCSTTAHEVYKGLVVQYFTVAPLPVQLGYLVYGSWMFCKSSCVYWITVYGMYECTYCTSTYFIYPLQNKQKCSNIHMLKTYII